MVRSQQLYYRRQHSTVLGKHLATPYTLVHRVAHLSTLVCSLYRAQGDGLQCSSLVSLDPPYGEALWLQNSAIQLSAVLFGGLIVVL